MTAIAQQAYLPPYVLGLSLSPVLPGETRCHHDMLDGQCSWCLGHPEVGEENCE